MYIVIRNTGGNGACESSTSSIAGVSEERNASSDQTSWFELSVSGFISVVWCLAQINLGGDFHGHKMLQITCCAGSQQNE